jgi:hypothetical protein
VSVWVAGYHHPNEMSNVRKCLYEFFRNPASECEGSVSHHDLFITRNIAVRVKLIVDRVESISFLHPDPSTSLFMIFFLHQQPTMIILIHSFLPTYSVAQKMLKKESLCFRD